MEWQKTGERTKVELSIREDDMRRNARYRYTVTLSAHELVECFKSMPVEALTECLEDSPVLVAKLGKLLIAGIMGMRDEAEGEKGKA
ncbi:MAG TPA: hypothetical protein VJ739_06780 [Gemmataceae bacterium]|nr:hypothetical protein [Gemmataceae bacterium]